MAGKTELVEQIKSIQRSDASAKQAWWHHCDTQLGGIKDPNRHDAAVLQEFLSDFTSGAVPAGGPPAQRPPAQRPPAQRPPASRATYGGQAGYAAPAQYYMPAPAAQWGFAGGNMMQAVAQAFAGAGGPGLADFIKTGQRQSGNFKTAWYSYCAMNGTGLFDPAKYNDEFIVGFIDYVGKVANQELSVQCQEQGIDVEALGNSGKRPFSGGGDAPPQKRAAYRPSAAPIADAGGDDEKTDLVAKIKDLQRSSQEMKEAWWSHCDETLGGVRDPNRHDKDTLEAFLSSYA